MATIDQPEAALQIRHLDHALLGRVTGQCLSLASVLQFSLPGLIGTAASGTRSKEQGQAFLGREITALVEVITQIQKQVFTPCMADLETVQERIGHGVVAHPGAVVTQPLTIYRGPCAQAVAKLHGVVERHLGAGLVAHELEGQTQMHQHQRRARIGTVLVKE